jgi:hypothetical protein
LSMKTSLKIDPVGKADARPPFALAGGGRSVFGPRTQKAPEPKGSRALACSPGQGDDYRLYWLQYPKFQPG